jgi:leader peptidase (prepilin peptidase)/N-methyltransferase
MDSKYVFVTSLFVLGLLIGSFLNVVIWRVPRRESIVKPRSYCPSCRRQIAWYDNVPLVSWLILKRRCRACSEIISLRYVAVEILTGILFVASFTALESSVISRLPTPYFIELIALLVFASISVAIAFIDGKTGLIPNSLVLWGVASALLLDLGTLVQQTNDLAVGRPLAAGALSFCFFLTIKLISPNGLGWGDVKLAFPLGMVLGFFGWGSLIIGGMAAFGFASAYSLFLVALRSKRRKSFIYLGPWLVTGAWAGILSGEKVWALYLGFIDFLVGRG